MPVHGDLKFTLRLEYEKAYYSVNAKSIDRAARIETEHFYQQNQVLSRRVIDVSYSDCSIEQS